MTSMTGAQVLVRELLTHGVRHAFCVPGESFLAVLDALRDSPIRLVVNRHEAGSSIAAEAIGKLTGRPGVAFVTRGPGATHASAGVHIARQDSTPLILFVGQIERGFREREAFQELDYRAVFGSMAKWVTEIDDAARIPELISRAFHTATAGRPGPVVIALPEDMLVEPADVPPAPAFEPVETWPGNADMMRLQKLLWAAERPLVLLGGSGWSARACAAAQRFAERFDLPVAVSFRRQHLFDATHPNYAGDVGLGISPALVEAIRASDLIVMAGGRLSEIPSQSYTLLDIPVPRQTLVHVHADAEELGRVYRPHLAINASPGPFAAALEGLQPPTAIGWTARTRALNAAYRDWSDLARPIPGPVQLGDIVTALRERMPPETIVTNGAGNFAGFVHRYWRFRRFGTQLAPTSGSMGYALPAAVGAKVLHPDRPVVCVTGDGDSQMTIQEFGTMAQYGLAVVVVVVDNGIYGTIRMHQEREFPGRVVATDIVNPDFAALARAYGGHGETVTQTAQFAPAFERALASGKPAIVHVVIDPEAITTTTTIAAIRAKALAAGR